MDSEKAALIEAGQHAAARDLKDPDSATFRDTQALGNNVCGQINAKNAFGAYVGFRPFYAVRSKDGGWSAAVSQNDISREDASWCLSSVTAKHRDNKFFTEYEDHHCMGMDAGFQLLYLTFCPTDGTI
jgi:hypothetical protein